MVQPEFSYATDGHAEEPTFWQSLRLHVQLM